MTVKEFSEVYDVPYRIAYEVTYRIKPVKNDIYCKDYNEKELYKAVQTELNNKIFKHLTKVHDLNDIKTRMREKRSNRLGRS